MELWGWNSTETRLEDGAVESCQQVWTPAEVVAMDEHGARELTGRYWRIVRRTTHGLVRVRESERGVDIRLPLGPPLLRFGPAAIEVDGDDVTATHPIVGGLLVRERTGTIRFSQRRLSDRVLVESAIAGFHPTLAARPGAPEWTGQLYKRLQARLHVAISRRYFSELAGTGR